MGKFVVRETATGSKFDLKAGNGEVIATSQVYASKASCLKGVESVKENAPIAPVENRTKEGFAVEKNPKFEVYADKRPGSEPAPPGGRHRRSYDRRRGRRDSHCRDARPDPRAHGHGRGRPIEN